ncbi:hypothetical protein RHECNPAF_4460053 [Rhizobium etli CNPAF512]|nr:hypothetical protein RHECNPAF_4460053 [Rhizobium etli CNPAF512]
MRSLPPIGCRRRNKRSRPMRRDASGGFIFHSVGRVSSTRGYRRSGRRSRQRRPWPARRGACGP